MRKLWFSCWFFLACSGSSASSSADTDDLGHPIPDRPSRRIVSLAPVITEMLFSIGAGDVVVGRTDWGRFPPDVADVPSVGAGLSPNVEAVASRSPDLVLLYSSPSNDAAIAQFETLELGYASFRIDGLGDVGRVARVFGALTNSADTADSLSLAFEEQLSEARAALDEESASCTVAIIVWDQPPMVIGKGSFLNELVELASGRNVFEDVATPDAEVSIETIAVRDPDAIIALGSETPAYADRSEWQAVRAVRDRAFVLIEGSEYEYPSFRSIEAARSLEVALEGTCAR